MVRPRILAVEDDDDLRYLYETFLSSEGFEVVSARHGSEALQKLAEDPDVILLDLVLPGMDGYTFLRELRRHPDKRDTPVIVLSAAVPPSRHKIAGADAFIRKPFDFDSLLHVIEGFAQPSV